ncbi:hypothetical protein QJS66_04745 [Kocuria rhizophila]|nr:hypothetical protein QJS66_04745 [Kocuria rhizophila]
MDTAPLNEVGLPRSSWSARAGTRSSGTRASPRSACAGRLASVLDFKVPYARPRRRQRRATLRASRTTGAGTRRGSDRGGEAGSQPTMMRPFSTSRGRAGSATGRCRRSARHRWP